MKRILLLIIVVLVNNASCAQNETVKVIENFINDLRANQTNDPDLIDKYFKFKENLDAYQKQEVVLPMLTQHLDLIRQRLNKDCTKMKIIKHDSNSDLIKSFNLKTENVNNNNVYYITCDGTIITPVLIEHSKILSVSAYSKKENGVKTFLIF